MRRKKTIILYTDNEDDDKKLKEVFSLENSLNKIRIIPKYELVCPDFLYKQKSEVKKLREQIIGLKDYIEENEKLKEYLGDFYIVNIGETFEVKGVGNLFKICSKDVNLTSKSFNEYVLSKLKDTKEIKKRKAIWTSYVFIYHANKFCAYNYRVNGLISDKESGHSKEGQEFLKIFIPQKGYKNTELKTYSDLAGEKKEYFNPEAKVYECLFKYIKNIKED